MSQASQQVQLDVRAQYEAVLRRSLDDMMKINQQALGNFFGANGAAAALVPTTPAAATPSVPTATSAAAKKPANKASVAKPANKKSAAATAAKSTNGVKRDEGQIEDLKKRFLAYVQENPGQGIEDIAKGIKCSTKELNLPKAKLLKEKLVQTLGEKRSTKYFPLTK